MAEHRHAHLNNFDEREKILPSRQILTDFGLGVGWTLADLGCGFGFFTLTAAEIVGPEGHIAAVDIDMGGLDALNNRAKEKLVADRIETYVANSEVVPLPDASVHIALIANVLHELHDPLSYLREAWRILIEEGQIWVIEWQKKETRIGPPLQDRRSMDEWTALLTGAGFRNIWTHIHEPGHVFFRGNR